MNIALDIGLPQAIYLAMNIILSIFVFIKGSNDDRSQGYGSTVVWIFVTLPILYWGGFFTQEM